MRLRCDLIIATSLLAIAGLTAEGSYAQSLPAKSPDGIMAASNAQPPENVTGDRGQSGDETQTGDETQMATVSGTVTYRQRIALPPNAQLVIKLEDVSRADAPSTVIAEQTIVTTGQQVPIPFTLTYDPAKIESRAHYTVRAQIFYGDRLRWTSTTLYPVINQGNSTEVEIQLEQVRGSN